MRFVLAIMTALALNACATKEDDRFVVGANPKAYVVIGVAEAEGAAQEAAYTMLWRRVDPVTGRFTDYGERSIFEPRTNSNSSLRIDGIPGEFVAAELEPGTYALDSVFAVIRDHQLNYFAQGVVNGPERPSFEVRPGEAVYLGIWQMQIGELYATTAPWRLDSADIRAVERVAHDVNGRIETRETSSSRVECAPRRASPMSQRQIC